MTNPKVQLGLRLLRLGARLALSDDRELEKLKHIINAETNFGSQLESGGHIHSQLSPLCDCEMISIRLALQRLGSVDLVTTDKKTYLHETWKDHA